VSALFWNNRDEDDFAGAHRLLLPVEDSFLRESNLLKLHTASYHETLDALLSTFIPFINLGIMIGSCSETKRERAVLRAQLANCASRVTGSKTRINFSIFCTMPLPGTPLGRLMTERGRVRYSIDEYPELWNVFVSVLQGDSFSPEDVTHFRHDILTEYGMDQSFGKVGSHRSTPLSARQSPT
jgi:hypothetical protein